MSSGRQMRVRCFSMPILFVLNYGIYQEFAEYTSAQERIALGRKGRKVESKQRREEMKSLIADTYGNPPIACKSLTPLLRLEDNEEEKEWEQEQIRRAGHLDHAPETQVPAPQVYKPSPGKSPSEIKPVFSDTRVVPATIPIPTLEPAIARLSQTLSNLTTSHSTNVSALTSSADELSQIEEREKELREAIERTEAQRSWFTAFREFVEGVAHFLDEKVKYPLSFLGQMPTQYLVSRAGETRGGTHFFTQRKIRHGCGT